MKRFILPILFISLSTLLFASNKDDEKNEGKPEILFEATNYDFGYIKESKGLVSCTFEFENTGTAPLLIIEATANCGCTKPTFPVKPIKPGKKGKIKVSYNPAHRPGGFRKAIKVKTNCKKKVHTLYIEGSVIPVEEEK